MARTELEAALAEGGSIAQLKRLLAAELDRSQRELKLARSGYEEPVTVAFASGLLAVFPTGASERAAAVASAVEAALHEVGVGQLQGGEGVLSLPGDDPELAALAFDEAVTGVDRLRARALVVPDGVIEPGELRPVLRTTVTATVPSPHHDPDPARKAARRMLLTLRGKGKWGGYHSEVTNLARGFREDWDLAERVGEALIDAGLLMEKPSVGQRHVSLNPRRKADIDRLVDEAVVPADLKLP